PPGVDEVLGTTSAVGTHAGEYEAQHGASRLAGRRAEEDVHGRTAVVLRCLLVEACEQVTAGALDHQVVVAGSDGDGAGGQHTPVRGFTHRERAVAVEPRRELGGEDGRHV